jgi:citrate lyase subunit beta-like protein
MGKSLLLNADIVTYDLEDSVLESHKASAREELRSHLQTLPPDRAFGEVAVRINALSTRLALPDLISLGSSSELGCLGPPPQVDAVVVPKVLRASDVTFVADVLHHVAPGKQASENPIKIIALVESAGAIQNLGQICAASPYLDGVIFGAEDFARDLSLTRTPSLSEFLYARSAIATAARAANLSSCIDLVCTRFRGGDAQEVLEAECRNGKGMGFNGKQCIHPSQLETVNRLFSPSEEEIEWALRLLIANQKAEVQGRGAWTMDGKMIDAPVVGHAIATIAKAEECGFDLDPLRREWEHQEPE